MLLKKSFRYSCEKKSSNLFNYFHKDKITISFSRNEYNMLCNCLGRLVEVEPKYAFYRQDARELVHELFSLADWYETQH